MSNSMYSNATDFVNLLKEAERTNNKKYVELVKNEVTFIRCKMAKVLESGGTITNEYSELMDRAINIIVHFKSLDFHKRRDFYQPGLEGLCYVCEHQQYYYTASGSGAVCTKLPDNCPYKYTDEDNFKKWRALEDSVLGARLVNDSNKPNVLRDFYRMFQYGDKELTTEESFDVARRVDVYNAKFNPSTHAINEWSEGTIDFMQAIIVAWAKQIQKKNISHEMARNVIKLVGMSPNTMIDEVVQELENGVPVENLGVAIVGMKDGDGNIVKMNDFIEFIGDKSFDELSDVASMHARQAHNREEVEEFFEDFGLSFDDIPSEEDKEDE